MSWRQLLKEAVARSSMTAVAAELGVSRPSVSMLVNGKYPGNTRLMAERIIEKYGPKRVCPVYGGNVDGALCAARKMAAIPTSSPMALRKWRECKKCDKGEKQC